MSFRSARIAVLTSLWLAGIAGLIYALNIGKIQEIPGTQFVHEIELCKGVDCAQAEVQKLPYFSPMRLDVQTERRDLRATIIQQKPPSGIQALYFPKFSDNFDLRVNGQKVFENSLPKRLWNTPLLVSIPEELVRTEKLQIDITLYGQPTEGLDLQPFYFGPVERLAPSQAARNFFGPGLAQFSLGLMIILGTALLIVWLYRPGEYEYLWLGLACLMACIMLTHFGYGALVSGYQIGAFLWIWSVSFYVLLILKFLRRLMGVPPQWDERIHFVAATGFIFVVLLSPPGYVFILSISAHFVVTIPSAICSMVFLWKNRSKLPTLDFWIFYVCLSLAVSFGLYELYLLILNAPDRTMHLFHLMPLVMSLACLWLILSRLITSLREYEGLTVSLSHQVAEKSAALAEIQRKEAIAQERDRIMLDLHDGIGGQLMNALAYMRSKNIGDGKVQQALEDALRDLGLMLDSMENHDSLVTLLGMLRLRLESLLSEHGLEFDWQVYGEPKLSIAGPSQSLQIARIVQEAITNVIKHAQADKIIVFVDESSIRISDNGKGFDTEAQATRDTPSHGLANMKRRSAEIGAEFSLASSPSGTSISLRF